MSNEVIKLIEKSVKEMKDFFPDIYFSYDYDEKSNSYEIWHNSKESRQNVRFKEYVGRIISENLFDEGVFNFYVDYNEEKSNEYEFYTKYLESFNCIINSMNIDNFSILDENIDLNLDAITYENNFNYKKTEYCNHNYSLAA